MNTERPWLSIYPGGVPANIDPSSYNSVVEFVKKKCEEHKKKSAFSLMGTELTYGEIDKLSTQFGAYLQSRGLETGDKFAIMMPNLLQYPIALIGALKAGLIVVNTNPLYTPREMEHQFKDSEVKGIVIAENFAANLEKILGQTSIKVIITTTIGEMLGLKGSMVNFAVKNLKRMVPKFELPNTTDFKTALKQGKGFTLQEPARTPEDVVVHQYTGGTTGVSKGAMLTNRNLIANLLQIRAFLDPYVDKSKDTIVLAPLPLYHIFAFTCNCLAMMDLGALSVLVVNPRDLSSVVKEFNRYKITGLTGVNTLYNALCNFEDFKKVDFSALEFASAGGTALQSAVAEKWDKITGNVIGEGYGMTEASPVITSSPRDIIKLGTVGIPVPSTDVRIVDDNGVSQDIGNRGEILVKGPQVMKGYYNRPEATAETITSDGWLKTGDIGIMDEKGYLRIVDRKKDMILVSGFNVYPNEIEDVIAAHPKVLEVAAIGIPDEKSGEVVKVFIVKSDKSLNEDEVIAHCRENLTGYKIPKQVEFKEDLPKSNVGKILRRELRES
jgi:long-chain acyl-CoA synthetase